MKLDLEYKLASEWDQRGTTLDQEREGLFEWEPRHELRHFEQRATTIDRPRVRKGLLILPPEIFRGRPSIVLDGFQFDKQSLLPFHHSLVDRIARYVVARSLSPRPVHRIGLVGHTDSRGTASYNQALGQKRAVAVQKALMERISSLRPALTRRIIFIAQSRGATQPVAPSSTPSGRERNRRVSVFLQLSPPTMAAAEDIRTRSSAGLCCMLAPEILNSLPNLADPANLGRHLFGGASVSSENNGLLYSGAFGFLQIALIRDACDDTKRVIDQLRSSAGAPGTVLKTAEGEARVLSRIPNNLFFDVARAIAYDAALGREIFFYFRFAPGGHNNAFSPENLPSSFLGTMVGVKATQRGGNFEAAVTRELNILISGSRSQPKAETLNAFNKINGCWVKSGGDVVSLDYLRRRNFTLVPWKAGHPADVTTPASVFSGFGNAEQFYTYTYKNALGQPIPKSSAITPGAPKFDYSTEIARARFDAWTRYGYNLDKKYGYYFDQPNPCP